MTYEDFLKTFIEKNKSNVTRDRLFGGKFTEFQTFINERH